MQKRLLILNKISSLLTDLSISNSTERPITEEKFINDLSEVVKKTRLRALIDNRKTITLDEAIGIAIYFGVSVEDVVAFDKRQFTGFYPDPVCLGQAKSS